MPFSVLLLTAASAKRQIKGKGNSQVVMSGQPVSGELALFFSIDQDLVRRGLNMQGKQCCDGLIFYAHDGVDKKIICLVELKSHNNLGDAADQIIKTRDHLAEMLKAECQSCNDYLKHVVWRACIYRHSATQQQSAECARKLKNAGFKEVELLRGDGEIGSYLRRQYA